jgi:hypothetical protein
LKKYGRETNMLGDAICLILFFGSIVFLKWLSIAHPPYDWKEEARKIRAEQEKELEDYKRKLRNG